MKKVIIYGVGRECDKLFDNFLGLIEHVEVFVDKYSSKNLHRGLPVIHPTELEKNDYLESTFIVATRRVFYEEIEAELIDTYGVVKENIRYYYEWLAELLEKDTNVVVRPVSVGIEASTLCQLNCVSCYMRKTDYASVGKGVLKFEDFKRFIEDYPFIQRVELSNNGEVFLNPDIDRILEYAYEKNVEITMLGGVNFNYIADSTVENLVKYNVKNITVAIDGASQEIYEKYRRNGNFNKVISNIKKVNQFKEKYQSNYPHMMWQYILMEHNECDVEKAKEMAKDLEMIISFKLDWAGSFKPQNAEKLSEITGLTVFNRNEYFEKTGELYAANLCNQLVFKPYINWDGRLLGCCCVHEKDWKRNVFEDNFIEALNSGEYKKSVLKVLGSKQELDTDNPCMSCRYHVSL